jgi:hypothetical protein
MPGPVP